MFKIEYREFIKEFVKRFIIITKQFMLLGRSFDNANLVQKVLRSLTEEWQPKVTTIKESLNIGILTI